MKLAISLLAIVAALFGGAAFYLTNEGARADMDTANELVIVMPNNEEVQAYTSKALQGKGYWELAEADLVLAEQLIAQEIEASYPNLTHKWQAYRAQYWGFFNEEGEKRIFANYFCEDDAVVAEDLKARVVLVRDGGDCYFQTVVNPAQQKLEFFSKNEEA